MSARLDSILAMLKHNVWTQPAVTPAAAKLDGRETEHRAQIWMNAGQPAVRVRCFLLFFFQSWCTLFVSLSLPFSFPPFFPATHPGIVLGLNSTTASHRWCHFHHQTRPSSPERHYFYCNPIIQMYFYRDAPLLQANQEFFRNHVRESKIGCLSKQMNYHCHQAKRETAHDLPSFFCAPRNTLCCVQGTRPD